MSNSRLEKFIYAICGMDVDDLPTPLSRIETLWNCLITGEVPDFEPLSRNEKYLMAMLNGDVDGLPEPTSRSEKLLYKIATGETDLSDVPGYLSRYEELLKQLIENDGIGGTDFEYVLYTLNRPLSTLYSTAEDIVNTATIYGDTVVNILQEPSDLAVTPIGENIDISNTTVNGTVEGKVKSAILSGQTLVNQSTTSELAFENVWQGKNIEGNALQSGKKYFVSFDLESDNSELTIQARNGNSFVYHIHKGFTKGKNVLSFILEQDANGLRFQVGNDFNVKISNIIILEYQDGMENWDIPYFEGMQSVKMPVLTTTGKNLFDEQVANNRNIDVSTGEVMNTGNRTVPINFIPVKPNTTYSFTRPVVGGNVGFRYYSQNQSFIGSRAFTNFYNQLSVTSTTPSDCYFLKFIDEANTITKGYQLEESSSATSYKPHKSNILSCNEEVILRGIGDVQDTLDCLTGQVTQRIGEIMFDGSETSWGTSGIQNQTETMVFQINSNTIKTIPHPRGGSLPICDKLPSNNTSTNDTEGILVCQGTDGHGFYIRIKRSKLSTQDVNGLKTYLQSNPITIQYVLETPIIKTVDLSITDQDGNETSHLHTFNDTTHISTSAECLLPNVVIPADISYPSIIKANTLYTVKLKRPVTNGNLLINLGGTEQLVTSDCFTIQTPATLTSQNVIFSGKGNVISEVTVVEGDHTEKEYGYFEGMMSVQMPVLTTTGKNLFDKNGVLMDYVVFSDGTLGASNGNGVTDFIKVSKGKTYVKNDGNSSLSVYSSSKTFIKRISSINTYTSSDEGYIRWNISAIRDVIDTLQIEEGSVATSYEPYKSNILTTTSKNLFNMNRPYDNLTDSQATVVQDTNQITVSSSAESGIYVNANFILDKDFFAGKTVTGSCLYESDENDIGTVQIVYQDGDGEHHYQWIKTPRTFTFPNSFIGDVMLSVSANNTGTPQSNTVTVKNIQLELGSTATSYEPYSEEVTLRGIGEVKDELSVLTSEVVERTGEIVLNGNESWKLRGTTTDVLVFNVDDVGINSFTDFTNSHKKMLCDKFVCGYYENNNVEFTCCRANGKGLLIGILKSRLSTPDIEGLKAWLSSNNVTVQYQLANEQIKTVGLSITDQDGQPTKLKTFNDITHVSIEAEDLLPTVDLEVPTKIEETLSTLPTLMNDISETQQLLNESIDDQAKNINEVSTAITEIHNDIL